MIMSEDLLQWLKNLASMHRPFYTISELASIIEAFIGFLDERGARAARESAFRCSL